jgi:hypothetical protein
VSEWYLIWSHDHGGWWLRGRSGYTRDPRKAGRYGYEEALAICIRSVPDAPRYGALTEFLVAEIDILKIISGYEATFGLPFDLGPDAEAAPGFRGTYPT